jgi:hypothetical protein
VEIFAKNAWAHRTPHVSDQAHLERLLVYTWGHWGATATMSGQARAPRTLTVTYPDRRLPDGTAPTLLPTVPLEDRAVALLGSIADLDRVTLTDRYLPGGKAQTVTMSAAEASRRLGFDVKQLGTDRQKLDAFFREVLIDKPARK